MLPQMEAGVHRIRILGAYLSLVQCLNRLVEFPTAFNNVFPQGNGSYLDFMPLGEVILRLNGYV